MTQNPLVGVAIGLLLLVPMQGASGQRLVPFVGKGEITGTVIDVNSQPVEGAEVHAWPVGGGAAMGLLIPWAETDARGHFAIRSLPLLRYDLDAGKPSAGYPEGLDEAKFYHDSNTPSVTLTARLPSAAVIIRLGLKPALVEGTITNAESGAPIINATAEITRVKPAPRVFARSLPQLFRLFVPVERTTTVEFAAPGFRSARVSPALTHGESTRIDVALQPTDGTPPGSNGTASGLGPQFAAGTGEIRGEIVGGRPRSTAEVLVFAMAAGSIPSGATMPWARATPDGRFRIDGLGWGIYMLGAADVHDGFPPSFVGVFAGDTGPVVSLSLNTPKADAQLRMPARAAALNGVVLNAVAGTRVVDAQAEVSLPGRRERRLLVSLANPFRLLIPAGEPVTVEISANGLLSWRATLTLPPGESKPRTVKLQPAPPTLR